MAADALALIILGKQLIISNRIPRYIHCQFFKAYIEIHVSENDFDKSILWIYASTSFDKSNDIQIGILLYNVRNNITSK